MSPKLFFYLVLSLVVGVWILVYTENRPSAGKDAMQKGDETAQPYGGLVNEVLYVDGTNFPDSESTLSSGEQEDGSGNLEVEELDELFNTRSKKTTRTKVSHQSNEEDEAHLQSESTTDIAFFEPEIEGKRSFRAHVVAENENLNYIADAYSLQVDSLMAHNKLSHEQDFQTGDTLWIKLEHLE